MTEHDAMLEYSCPGLEGEAAKDADCLYELLLTMGSDSAMQSCRTIFTT
jgi:hypothetical protein